VLGVSLVVYIVGNGAALALAYGSGPNTRTNVTVYIVCVLYIVYCIETVIKYNKISFYMYFCSV